ncbi:MAG: ABC transporter permease subunit [Candidatus Thiodiazotropha weberae]|nr:ABC transporter permease subunit [Candidatus Thiodiazotropha lotti]MCG8011896.1 ABC transporter permease subunit [Candidatus Thiodiazotropha lotti]MCW4211363.1 ABC transporter permease subunit [Candidatus Thiodiazotropha lotti]MCW4216774.1 ABC transporter permease subunit [Candidatus Thiodiazotropha lotti]
MNSIDIIVRYQDAFIGGLLVTLHMSVIIWISGLTFGCLIGIAAHHNPKFVGYPLRSVAFLLSGIPLLVMLYWAHYPLQTLFKIVVDPFITATALLSIINIIIVAEVWRSAFDNFRTEYILAAKVCGLNQLQTLRKIKIPLVVRHTLPMLLTVQVTMLQMTLFSSLISVEELFRIAQRINSTIHMPVEIYSALAIFFLAICLPPYFFAYWLQKKYSRDLSEK